MNIYTLFRTCKDKDYLLEVLKQKPNLDVHGITLSRYIFYYCKNKDVLLEVLKQKPNLNSQNDDGDTVAMYAFEYCEDKEILLELIKKANLSLKNFQK
tara:strand:- start:2064 stop:2357 length:294 start_codon:yes stop_codon:yes gene_type:complete